MLKIQDEKFYLNGKETKIYSGAIHYFRIIPEQWEDRLKKLKAAGFNTVETYVPWNIHEPQKGNFCFDGICDFVKFLKIAQRLGLSAIMRPSPYICSEWDFGGFPAWLLKENDMAYRCMDEKYISHMCGFFDAVLPRLKPLLASNGGNIIAMQIENEYGSYSNDKNYLQFIHDYYIKHGMDCLLFTSDGPHFHMISGGALEGVYTTLNFGALPKMYFQNISEQKKPKFCMEFWCGWFDWWGEAHHTRPTEEIENTVKEFFEEDANFNFYMFCGGTNFGFNSGANFGDNYTATTTSYDYCAPLSEWGGYTQTYHMLRKLLHEKQGLTPPPLPKETQMQNIGKVELTQTASLFDNLGNIAQKHKSVVPKNMEYYGQNSGLIYYETIISGIYGDSELSLQNAHDIAYVYVDGKKEAAYSRMDYGVFKDLYKRENLVLPQLKGQRKIGVLVEAMGRVNYGAKIGDKKGLANIFYSSHRLTNFDVYTIPLDNMEKLQYSSGQKECPAFFKGTFKADKNKDCFIDFSNFTKGCIFVNGFNLGRFWDVGPQLTLYLPYGILKDENEIVVFEQEKVKAPCVNIIDKQIISASRKAD